MFGPDEHLYVSDHRNHRVLRFDGATGEYLNVFVTPKSGGLERPNGLAFGPDHDLYVVSRPTDQVLRFDGQTGQFMDVFIGVDGGQLEEPINLLLALTSDSM